MSRFWLALALLGASVVLWRSLRAPRRRRPEQAVLLTLRLADASGGADRVHARLRQLDEALRAAVAGARAGQVEDPFRHGIDCVYTVYGPDADRLWDVVHPVLQGAPLRPGSFAVRRYGAPGAPEERVDLA